MRPIQYLALAILIPFLALTLYAVSQVGYIGIFTYQLLSPAGWQVGVDLVIAVFLALLWIIRDARRSGRTAWPYLVMSLFLGSIGVLLYLLLSGKKPAHEKSLTQH